MLKFKFLSYFEFMQTICTNFFHKQIFHSSSGNFTIPKLLLEFIFSFSVTGYWFNNICLHQIGKKFWSTWTFQPKKFHNCTSSKHLIETKLFKKSMDMNRRFYREITTFLRVRIVCTDKCVSEIPRIFPKRSSNVYQKTLTY